MSTSTDATVLDTFERVFATNPFQSAAARVNSSYSGYAHGELVRLLDSGPAEPFARIANDAFREFVGATNFSCLGAKAAINRGTYRIGTYERLADRNVTEGLMRDLYAFVAERRLMHGDFTTYVAVFRDAPEGGLPAFEAALWAQLQRIHQLDRRYHAWDPRVSADPNSPDFSFSVAGEAFFVVGLDPHASRSARRFAWPTLVFNAHEQFERLREAGTFDGLQARIRSREVRLDGSLNVNLADFGQHTEARQYSGAPADASWRCPFDPNR